MTKGYSIIDGKIIIDFTSLYCETSNKLLGSDLFKEIFDKYLKQLIDKESIIYDKIVSSFNNSSKTEIKDKLLILLRLLDAHEIEDIGLINHEYVSVLKERENLYDFTEGLYNFWRHYERYILMTGPETRLRTRVSVHHAQFIKSNETLKALVLQTYRSICEKLMDNPFRVYRQLPAGAQMGLFTQHIKWDCPEEYQLLKQIPFIRLTILEPPVIFYPKKNTRKGLFKEINQNPVKDFKFSKDGWFCYPAKIGKLLAFAYFHKSFMSHGTSLSNLFELADYEDIKNKKPDIVLIFGGHKLDFTNEITMFHKDSTNEIMVGYEVATEDIDYFGYMKKMLLTLHNVNMIDKGLLPIHGAMVSIRLKTQKTANIIIMGDSGAGKSETLEAFRQLAKDYINDMTIIFDDMGSLEITEDGTIIGYGTEVGAFLRLDDLQPGYAYEQIDRSIFMNPHQTNARLIFPVTAYKKIISGTPIDFFLYANNYDPLTKKNQEIQFFNSPEEALAIFNTGKRLAKGTTSETGLVDSYFANPFGAPQRRQTHEILAEKFVNQMFSQKIKVGEIRTQLAIEGMEQEGPKIAAKALFDTI